MTYLSSTIEDQLSAQARGIFAAQPVDSAAETILAEHARRNRRRRTRRNAAAGLAAGVLLTVIVSVPLGHNQDAAPQKSAREARAAATTEPTSMEGQMLLARLREAALRDAGGEGAVAIPLLVTVGEWNGRPVVAPVVYVPPHARRIEHASLTKSERSAVERLLKLTSTTQGDRPDVTL